VESGQGRFSTYTSKVNSGDTQRLKQEIKKEEVGPRFAKRLAIETSERAFWSFDLQEHATRTPRELSQGRASRKASSSHDRSSEVQCRPGAGVRVNLVLLQGVLSGRLGRQVIR
jgi:hypothetical protein